MNRMFCPNCGLEKHKHTIHTNLTPIHNGHEAYTISSCGLVLEYRQVTKGGKYNSWWDTSHIIFLRVMKRVIQILRNVTKLQKGEIVRMEIPIYLQLILKDKKMYKEFQLMNLYYGDQCFKWTIGITHRWLKKRLEIHI